MLFLLIKIVILLLLTALFTAWLTWFLVSRGYEEVTESYKSFNEIDGRLGKIDARLAALDGGSKVDLTEVYNRIDKVDKRVAGIKIPGTDLSGVTSGIAAISSTVGALKSTDVGPVLRRIDALEAKLANMKPPATDLSEVYSRIEKVDQRVAGIKPAAATDLSQVYSRLEKVDQRVAAIKIPGTDLSGVTSGIAAISSTVAALKPTDVGPVLRRLEALEAKIAAIKPAAPADLRPVQSQLKAVEAKVDAIKFPGCNADLSGVNAHLTKIEGMIGKPVVAAKPKFDDLTKVEGIGPKIKELLWNDGITSFADLASAEVSRLQGVLDRGGKRFQVHKPNTWPAQSAYARDGRWDELKKWQDELDGGR